MATIVGGLEAEALTEDEIFSLGMSSIVHNGESDEDNEFVAESITEGSLLNLPQTDKEGRQIISWRQFLELGRIGARVDPYALRVVRPGRMGRWTIQASKYLKWYGLGYCHQDDHAGWKNLTGRDAPGAVKSTPKRQTTNAVELEPGVHIYYCRDKYPDCSRFFDNPAGLKVHWNRDHGEVPSMARKRKAVEAS